MGRREPRSEAEQEVALVGAIAKYFKFAERGTTLGTETRAGLTTFMVMAYIIFLNPAILMAGFGTRPGVHAGRALRGHAPWSPAS